MEAQELIEGASTTSIATVQENYSWKIENFDLIEKYGLNPELDGGEFKLTHQPSGYSYIMRLKLVRNPENEFLVTLSFEEGLNSTISYKLIIGDAAGMRNVIKNGTIKIVAPCGDDLRHFPEFQETLSCVPRAELLHCKDKLGNLTIFLDLKAITPILEQYGTQEMSKFPAVTVPNRGINGCFAQFYDNSKHSDVTLYYKGKVFPAHKLVLDQSAFFSTMLNSQLKEGLSSKISISDVEGSVMELVLKHLYGVQFDLPNDTQDLIQLLDCSEKYDLPYLKAMCFIKMAEILSDMNALDFTIAVYRYSGNYDIRRYFQSYCDKRIKILLADEQLKLLYVGNIEAFIA